MMVHKSMNEEETKKDFEKRAKAYLAENEILQNKHNVTVRPIITTYGPDIQLSDKLSQPAPVEQKEEVIKKV